MGHPGALRRQAAGLRVEVRGSGFSAAVVDELRARPEIAEVTQLGGTLLLDLAHDASMAPVVTRLVASGAQVEEVRKQEATLEDAYLALMREEEAP